MAMQSRQARSQAVQMLQPAMLGQAVMPEQMQSPDGADAEEEKTHRLIKKIRHYKKSQKTNKKGGK